MSKRKFEALKNYTTTISEEQTIMEIEKILITFGAQAIFKVYDEEQNVKAVSFQVTKKFGDEQIRHLAFKLPMEEQKVLQLLKQQRSDGIITRSGHDNIEQARRTGWRIIKDWIDSQVALLEIKMVKLEQIFLPYMWDMDKDETLYEKLEKNQFKMIEGKK